MVRRIFPRNLAGMRHEYVECVLTAEDSYLLDLEGPDGG